jgi:hypothetical protein
MEPVSGSTIQGRQMAYVACPAQERYFDTPWEWEPVGPARAARLCSMATLHAASVACPSKPTLNTGHSASAFQEDYVAPAAVHACQPLACSDNAEAQ